MKSSSELSTRQKWMDLVRQHEERGTAVKVFCRDRGVSEPSFYSWRKRLAASHPVRFALVDTGKSAVSESRPVELILVGATGCGLHRGPMRRPCERC